MTDARIHVVGAAIVRHDRCLVARRGAGMNAAHSWEFPGGKVESGERPEQALAREIREELGVEIEVGSFVGRGVAGHVVLDVYVARLIRGEPTPLEHAELAWLAAEELGDLAWADADVPVVEKVAAALRSRQS